MPQYAMLADMNNNVYKKIMLNFFNKFVSYAEQMNLCSKLTKTNISVCVHHIFCLAILSMDEVDLYESDDHSKKEYREKIDVRLGQWNISLLLTVLSFGYLLLTSLPSAYADS